MPVTAMTCARVSNVVLVLFFDETKLAVVVECGHDEHMGRPGLEPGSGSCVACRVPRSCQHGYRCEDNRSHEMAVDTFPGADGWDASDSGRGPVKRRPGSAAA
jgi:hypothetical protein